MAGYQKILHEASVNFSACASGAGPSEEERKAAAAELLDRVSHVQVPLLLLTLPVVWMHVERKVSLSPSLPLSFSLSLSPSLSLSLLSLSPSLSSSTFTNGVTCPRARRAWG